MRVSTRKSDPAYEPNANYDIYLNGKRVRRGVITADEERGEITVTAKDETGNFVVRGGEFVDEILRGRVEIRARTKGS